MKSFLNSLPFPAILVNRQQHIINYNESAAQEFTLKANSPLADAFADESALRSKCENILLGQQTVSYEYSPSEEKCFLVHFSTVAAENDACALIIFQDVSVYKSQLDNQMELMRCMAHELKAPLGAVSGYLDLILEGLAGSPEKEKEMIQKSRDRAQGLLDFIGEVLLYAKAGKNIACPTDAPVDISDILHGTIDLFATEAANKKLQYSADIAANVQVIANKIEISRVFTNLVSNAVKYTPENGSVQVTLARVNKQAILTVQDSGIGIPADEMDKLFTEFHRAANALQSKIPGTGLGMAITKKLVEKYGGTISATSKLNEGTTFTVKLECADEN